MTSDDPIENSVESIMALSREHGQNIIFISKCKKNYETTIKEWLHNHGLAQIPLFTCETYEGKVGIAEKHGVKIIIDDKLAVLNTFNDKYVKIWFCTDSKKIDGCRKHTPEVLERVRLVNDWQGVIDVILKQS
jgi:hypothetical protein